MEDIIIKFGTYLHTLSESEKHVIYFVNRLSKEQREKLSLVTLSEQTNVSTTTIIRLCKKIQLSGFSEFKYQITQSPLQEQSANEIETLVNKLFSSDNQIKYKMAAKQIVNSQRVILVGVGGSKTIAEYFSKLLTQVGINSIYIYESHMLTVLLRTITKKDSVIIISGSGKTQTILQIAEQLAFMNMQIIALTNNIDAPIHQYSTLNLATNVAPHIYNGFDISERSLMFLTIDLILKEILINL